MGGGTKRKKDRKLRIIEIRITGEKKKERNRIYIESGSQMDLQGETISDGFGRVYQ